MKDRRPNKPHRPHPSSQHRPPRSASGAPAPAKPGVAKSAAGDATHWGDVAEWYDDLVGESGSEYHRQVVLPGALRLLGNKSGDHVLDIACGQGVLCRMLARQGIRTTGVDAAPDLIRMAKDRNAQLTTPSIGNPQSAIGNPPLPVYHLADVRDLSFLREGEFDSAACILAIQNLHPIAPVCAAVARALKPAARFVIVMMHPCFRSPKETSWGWDERAMVQYRRVDRYLIPRKAPIVTHPGKGHDYTWSFHKPIEAYVRALRGAGMLIDALEEWPSHKTSTSGPRAPAENVARKEIPMFLAIRGIKVAGLPAADPDPAAAEST